MGRQGVLLLSFCGTIDLSMFLVLIWTANEKQSDVRIQMILSRHFIYLGGVVDREECHINWLNPIR